MVCGPGCRQTQTPALSNIETWNCAVRFYRSRIMNFAPGLPWVLAAGLALASLAASLHIRRAQFAERLLRIETKQRDAAAALERMHGSLQVLPGTAEGERPADGCADAPESGRTSAAAEIGAIPEGRP
jgi:hypothetical protein